MTSTKILNDFFLTYTGTSVPSRSGPDLHSIAAWIRIRIQEGYRYEKKLK
jgi:hypothetical protein